MTTHVSGSVGNFSQRSVSQASNGSHRPTDKLVRARSDHAPHRIRHPRMLRVGAHPDLLAERVPALVCVEVHALNRLLHLACSNIRNGRVRMAYPPLVYKLCPQRRRIREVMQAAA